MRYFIYTVPPFKKLTEMGGYAFILPVLQNGIHFFSSAVFGS